MELERPHLDHKQQLTTLIDDAQIKMHLFIFTNGLWVEFQVKRIFK